LSRFRASISPSETDREIQTALDRATREIEVALRLAIESGLPRHQTRKTVGDLRRVVDSIRDVRYCGASVPQSRESYEDWKARRDARREAKRSSRVKEQSDG